MQLKNLVLSVIFLLGTTAPSWGKVSGQVIEVAVRKAGDFATVLIQKGFAESLAGEVTGHFRTALRALSADGNSRLSMAKIRDNIQAIKTVGKEDARKKEAILYFLGQDVEKLSQKDLTDLVNNILFFANRYSNLKGNLLVCRDCAEDALSGHGIKYALVRVKDSNIRRILETEIPTNPREMRRQIYSRMRHMKLGRYSGEVRKSLSPENERSFAVFLALGLKKSGATPAQKKVFKAWVEIHRRPDGEVKILDPENFNQLYKLVETPWKKHQWEEWATILNQTAAEAQAEGEINKAAAFHRILRRMAGSNPEKQEAVDDIKAWGCYFKKV